jgi:hypothetical protein
MSIEEEERDWNRVKEEIMAVGKEKGFIEYE